MEEILKNHLASVIIAVIAFFVMRAIKNLDGSISKLDETNTSLEAATNELKLEMKDRPKWPKVKEMSQEVAKAEVSAHIINDH